MTSVDIGANYGIFSYVMRQQSARLVAFEPQPACVGFLARALPDVDVRPYAVSDRDDGTIVNPSDEQTSETPVRTVSIDSQCLVDVGFIRIGAKGHEHPALLGAERTIRRDRPNLLIRSCAVAQLSAFLTPIGYRGWYLQGGVLYPAAAFDRRRDQGPADTSARHPNTFVFVQPAAVPGLLDLAERQAPLGR